MHVRPRRGVPLALAAILLDAAISSASSFVMVKDEDLADRVPHIALVQVVGVEPAPDGRAATDYLVELAQAVKGDLPSRFTVRVPGGGPADGLRLKIFGAPRFSVGERALLFLADEQDGAHRIAEPALGAFHEVGAGDRVLAVRDLSELAQLPDANGSMVPEPTRDLSLFMDWLAARGNGIPQAIEYRIDAPPGTPAVTASFNVYTDPRVRWFDFDTAGGAVSWRGHEDGQIGVPGGGLAEIPTAQQAWNDDPDTPISYTYAGTTTAMGGFTNPDGVNAVLFNDPNDELAGSFNCSTGGLLAIGGFWYSGQTSVFEGLTYNHIAEGEVIIQDNAGCYMKSHINKDGEELLGHELGHSLGLAHSCGTDAAGGGSNGPCDTFEKNDAIMRSIVHGDGRGARLGSDDRAAIRLLYQQPPTISIGDLSVNEGDSGTINATFTLTLSRSAADTVSVAAASAEGTATSGTDFQAASGTVSFPAGTITATFVVPLIGDMVDEPNETFTVNLASPVGATVARAQATGAIVDDDDPPPTISIDDRTVAEGAASNAAFLVFLSGPSKLPVTVAYATVDGTGQAGFDFTATSGTLTVSPGRTTHSIFVPIVTDTSAEGTESFTVNLSAPTNATLARAIATGTITDPPAPVHAAMYRAYNRNADYHFFTTDAASRDFAVGLGYQDESNPVPFYVLNVTDATAVPLFRMYNPNLGRHYYTADVGSRDFLMSIGMNYEKDEGFVQPTPTIETTELFRLYNNNSGTHLFTADVNQKDGILSLFPGVWVEHTSVGYVFAGP